MPSNPNNNRRYPNFGPFWNAVMSSLYNIRDLFPCLRRPQEEIEVVIECNLTEEQSKAVLGNILLVKKIIQYIPAKDNLSLALTCKDLHWMINRELRNNKSLILKVTDSIIGNNRPCSTPHWAYAVHLENGTNTCAKIPKMILENVQTIDILSYFYSRYTNEEHRMFLVSFSIQQKVANSVQNLSAASMWQNLEEVYIEDVYEDHDQQDINEWLFLIQKLVVPKCLFDLIKDSVSIRKLVLKSLFLLNTTLSPLVDSIFNSENPRFIQNLHTIHLEDICTSTKMIEKIDNFFVSLIAVCPNKMNIVLSVQQHTYGSTLFKILAESETKFDNFHVIINLRIAETWIADCITKLHSHCESITLTFHRSLGGFGRPINFDAPCYFKKWTKVTEVRVGKRMYSYRIGDVFQRLDNNTLSYQEILDYIRYLPNLKSFTLNDQVNNEVLVSLRELLRSKELDELTIALAHRPGTMIEENEEFFNHFERVVSAIPKSVRYLTLVNVPLNSRGLQTLSDNLGTTLKKLNYFKNGDHRISNQRMTSNFKRGLVNCRPWMSDFSFGNMKYTISHFLDIAQGPPELDFFP